jgi:hypothetical protein
MTSPQDPNQPLQPGGAAPQGGASPSPDQPGWAAPPAANQPAWGSQPPSQPGWGTPPPPAGGQPGWGTPPPPAGGQPGWGAPPPGNQQGWGAPPPGWGQPPKRNRHGCLIAFIVVLVLLVIGVGGCAALAWPYIQTEIKLTQDLGSNASAVEFNNTNGTVSWIIHLKAGHDSADQAKTLVCTVVRPDLKGTQFANDNFILVDADGFRVADSSTSCP